MLCAIFVLLGVIGFNKMPIDLMPGGDSGVLTIFVGIRGGLPPEDIESLVTKIVEDEMATLPHLDEIISVSRKERAVITLNFKVGTDTTRSALEVQERLAKIRGKLPKDIEKPVVSRYDEGQSPVMILAMSSKNYTPEQMREVADNQLKPILKRVDGVGNIEIGGGREKKILVEFDKGRLEAYAIPINQVVGQIGQENLNLLSGKVEQTRDSYYVRTVGAFKTLEDIGNLPIAVTKEGSRIRLRDVAEIRDFYMEADSYSRLNREPVVSIYIQKETLANTISVAKKINEALETFKKEMDPKISLSVVSDRSIAIDKALGNLKGSLVQGALLVGFILLLFLRDLITTSYIFVTIPLSLVMTLAIMYFCGLSLDAMTILGLILASGQISDNSITVLENIHQYKRKLVQYVMRWNPRIHSTSKIPALYKPLVKVGARGELQINQDLADKTFAIEGTSRMFLVMFASTLTAVIVFLPIVFLNPQVRILYKGLSVTVTAALLCSLLVAVTIIPCLSANIPTRWVKESSFFSTYFWIFLDTKLKRFKIFFDLWYSKSERIFQKTLKKIWKKKKMDEDIVITSQTRRKLFNTSGGMRRYRHIVSYFMRKRYRVALVLILLVIGSGYLFKFLDKEFIGSQEENEFIIFVELPSGTKLDVSDKVVTEIEKTLNQIPEVQKSVKNSVARVEGWSSKIYVTLVPSIERTRTTQEVMNFLRPLVSKVGQEYDAFVYFSEAASAKEFVIDVFGYDYNKLRDIAVKIAQGLEKVPGLADIKLRYKPGRPEVRIEVDREKSSLFSFSVNDIAQSLHAQIRGLRATYFVTPTSQIETVARLQEQYRKTLEDIQNLTLINPKGEIISIRQLAKFEFGLTPSEIWRKDRERMIQVSANRGDVSLNKVAEKGMEALRQINIPTGYYYEIGGDYPKMIETEKESSFAFMITIILVYAVLASLFESYSQPFLILTAVPLTLIGVIPLLYITDTPVTLGTYIGFIMLGGISVNNSTILVDVFNEIRKDKNVLRALLQSGQERMRPILATTLTNVLGMIPLVLAKQGSGSLWSPMAMTVIGGMTASTLLLLFVLPGFYLIIQDIKSFGTKLFSGLLELKGKE